MPHNAIGFAAFAESLFNAAQQLKNNKNAMGLNIVRFRP